MKAVISLGAAFAMAGGITLCQEGVVGVVGVIGVVVVGVSVVLCCQLSAAVFGVLG